MNKEIRMLQVANDQKYRKLAQKADQIINRVIQEGDIVIRPTQGNRQEPHRVVGLDKRFTPPAFKVFNMQRKRLIEDIVFQRQFCYWVPGLDGMMEILLTHYKSPESVQETYLKWLKSEKNKVYRKGLVGMYAEFLAFMMDRIYDKRWYRGRWINTKK